MRRPIRRIRDRETLDHLHRRGANFRQGFMVMKVAPRQDGFIGLAFSIGRKKVRLAVRRNRLRRLVREWILVNRDRVIAGHNLLFIVLRDPQARRLRDIQGALESLFTMSGLIRREKTA